MLSFPTQQLVYLKMTMQMDDKRLEHLYVVTFLLECFINDLFGYFTTYSSFTYARSDVKPEEYDQYIHMDTVHN